MKVILIDTAPSGNLQKADTVEIRLKNYLYIFYSQDDILNYDIYPIINGTVQEYSVSLGTMPT